MRRAASGAGPRKDRGYGEYSVCAYVAAVVLSMTHGSGRVGKILINTHPGSSPLDLPLHFSLQSPTLCPCPCPSLLAFSLPLSIVVYLCCPGVPLARSSRTADGHLVGFVAASVRRGLIGLTLAERAVARGTGTAAQEAGGARVPLVVPCLNGIFQWAVQRPCKTHACTYLFICSLRDASAPSA